MKAIDIASAIDKANQEFGKLSGAKKRVEIAKDVISQIRKSALIPSPGTYIEFNQNRNVRVRQFEQFDMLGASGEPFPQCRVCAIGAAALSVVRKDNKHSGYLINAHEVSARFFSRPQRKLIEWAFEGWDITCEEKPPGVSVVQLAQARRFYLRHKRAPRRLLAIFKNIIRNKGTFKP